MTKSLEEKPDKYLNPFTDFGFKKLFGTEPNKDLLIDFLNQLIREEGNIIDIEYMNTEKLGNIKDDRKAIFDIYCKTEKGERFIVEMQKAKINYFKDRSIYYSTFPIQEQGVKGDWDFDLKAVYTIGLLDFVFDENKDKKEYFHHEIKLMDIKTKNVFFDKLTYVYIEMPKFKKLEAELETRFEKWLYILKNMPNLQDIPPKLQERIFKKVFRVAEIANFSRVERSDYEESLKHYRDLKGVLTTAKDDGVKEGHKKGLKEGLEKGLKEGIEKGKEEGLKEGIEKGKEAGLKEGIEKGRQEGIKEGKIKSAKLIIDIFDDKTIAEKLDLDIDEVKKLRK